MHKNNNKIAFVYHYWNIETLKSYYGYKESWNKKYSPFEIFVEHPIGEKSTNSHYCSSCKQKEWKQDCKDGKIYGEIIAVFTGDSAGDLAHEYEHQMIITHKALYGQESLYNRNDGYDKFSTSGKKLPHTKKWCENHSKTMKELYKNDPALREKRRQVALEKSGIRGNGHLISGEKNGMYGVHRYGKDAPNYKWKCPLQLIYMRNIERKTICEMSISLSISETTVKTKLRELGISTKRIR